MYIVHCTIKFLMYVCMWLCLGTEQYILHKAHIFSAENAWHVFFHVPYSTLAWVLVSLIRDFNGQQLIRMHAWEPRGTGGRRHFELFITVALLREKMAWLCPQQHQFRGYKYIEKCSFCFFKGQFYLEQKSNFVMQASFLNKDLSEKVLWSAEMYTQYTHAKWFMA
jgi:hypothetical protein